MPTYIQFIGTVIYITEMKVSESIENGRFRIVRIELYVVLVFGAKFSRSSKTVEPLHPGDRVQFRGSHLQGIRPDQVGGVVDLRDRSLEDGSAPAGVPEEARNSLGVVLEDQFGAIAVGDLDAIRHGKGVDGVGLGGEGIGYKDSQRKK